jgi:hypothetical protein
VPVNVLLTGTINFLSYCIAAIVYFNCNFNRLFAKVQDCYDEAASQCNEARR